MIYPVRYARKAATVPISILEALLWKSFGAEKMIENLTQILPKMVPKSMKIEVWGGLGGSGGRLGSTLEPRWRPRAARGGPRGAKMANLAPTWANLGRKWGPKSMENR